MTNQAWVGDHGAKALSARRRDQRKQFLNIGMSMQVGTCANHHVPAGQRRTKDGRVENRVTPKGV
jgi:hypothetical protein